MEGLGRKYDSDDEDGEQEARASSSEQIAVERQQEQQYRASLAELIVRQQQQERVTAPPRGFLGGEVKSSLLDDDADDEEDEDESQSSTALGSSEQDAEPSEEPSKTDTTRDVQITAVEQETLDENTVSVQPETEGAGSQRVDVDKNDTQASLGDRQNFQKLQRSSDPAPESANTAPQAPGKNENANRGEFAEYNAGNAPRSETENINPVEYDTNGDEPDENTLTRPGTASAATNSATSAGSFGSVHAAGFNQNPSAPRGGQNNAHPAPPTAPGPPSPPNSPPPPSRARAYPFGGPPPGAGNTWASATSAAGNFAASPAAANLIRTVERPHTHPGIIAALIVSHLIGAHRANQLRQDAERTRDDFNRRMKETNDRLLFQEEQSRKERIQASEQRDLGASLQQTQAGMLEAQPSIEAKNTEMQQYITQVQQHEQLVKNQEIVRREAEKLSKIRRQTLGVTPKPGKEHNLGPVDAALSNPNLDIGPPLEVPAIRRDSLNRPNEAEPPTDRQSELQRERGSESRDVTAGPGSSSQNSVQGLQSDLLPAAPFSSVSGAENTSVGKGLVQAVESEKNYSKAITGGFIAGIVIMAVAITAYFILR